MTVGVGPYLYLRIARRRPNGRTDPAVWIIRDLARMISTGLREDQRAQAELELERYIQEKKHNKIYYLYFLTCQIEDFPIKIGISESYISRFPALQTALPYDVEVLAIVPIDDPCFERVLHKKFEAFRLRGEWFSRSVELMSYIARLQDNPYTDAVVLHAEVRDVWAQPPAGGAHV